MAVDACEEKIDETIIRADGTPTHGAPKRDNAPKNTERTPAKDDPSFDIMRPGGKNSPFEKDGTPKKKKYNPYGSGTANPSNMSGSTGP